MELDLEFETIASSLIKFEGVQRRFEIVRQSDELFSSLIDSVKAAKGSVQAPKAIHFSDSIPLTPVGKPDKKQLISRYET